MRLAGKLIPWRYHLLDYDCTPLSCNPCWLSWDVHHRRRYKTSIRSRHSCRWASFERWRRLSEYQFIVSEVINLLQATYSDPGIVSAVWHKWLIPWSYQLLDYEWTPLSRNPGWLSSDLHHRRRYRTSIRSRPSCIWTSLNGKESWMNSNFLCMKM